MDDAMRDIWKLLLHPHKINEVARPINNEETEKFKTASREFDRVLKEFKRVRRVQERPKR